MALINCPECGREISDKANFCPHCGLKIKKQNKITQRAKVIDEERRRKIKKILISAITVVGVAVIGVVGSWYFKHAMPSLVNKNINEVRDLLNERDIDFTVKLDYTENFEKDIIYGQSVKPYALYRSGETVVVNISKGIFYTMPDIVGKSIQEIEEELKDLPVSYEYEYTDDIEKDIIIKTSVIAGKKFYDNSNAIVTVSQGIYTELPNLNKKNIDEAVAILDGIGLKYEIEEEYTAFNEGTVFNYSPKKYGDVNDTTIQVKVSKGTGIMVPMVVGGTIKEARQKLQEVGLGCKVVYTNNDTSTDSTNVQEGIITEQSISGRVGEAQDVILTINTPAIKITSVNFESNYVGGIDTYITFKNISDKQIAYIDIEMQYFDRMGYPANCEIARTSVQGLRYTGPLNAGSSSGRQCWDAVVYNSSIAAVQPKSATITFADGTKQKLTYSEYGTYWFLPEYYGGDLHN